MTTALTFNGIDLDRQLLDPEAWVPVIDRFARSCRLAVQLFDGSGQALTRVVNEQEFSKPQVATWLLNQFAEMQGTNDFDGEHKFQPLSGREMQILQCITSGESNKEIAKDLGISRQTVKNHMTSILRKLAVNDRTQAAVYALRHGWIRLQDTKQ